ncbi:Uncharacterised protein [Mycobacteroides abscessus subsp. abscessus]|nr:Uncharacterised protein [Mycobacteroides abscessus subsp. abscessus]
MRTTRIALWLPAAPPFRRQGLPRDLCGPEREVSSQILSSRCTLPLDISYFLRITLDWDYF